MKKKKEENKRKKGKKKSLSTVNQELGSQVSKTQNFIFNKLLDFFLLNKYEDKLPCVICVLPSKYPIKTKSLIFMKDLSVIRKITGKFIENLNSSSNIHLLNIVIYRKRSGDCMQNKDEGGV